MSYGLESNEWKLIHEIFAQNNRLERAVLYGSRAKETHKPFSDVDITLVGEKLTEDDMTDFMYQLDESTLPYFFDLSLFANIKNPALVDHIKRRGKTIYERKTL